MLFHKVPGKVKFFQQLRAESAKNAEPRSKQQKTRSREEKRLRRTRMYRSKLGHDPQERWCSKYEPSFPRNSSFFGCSSAHTLRTTKIKFWRPPKTIEQSGFRSLILSIFGLLVGRGSWLSVFACPNQCVFSRVRSKIQNFQKLQHRSCKNPRDA